MLLFYVRHGDPIYDPDQLTPLGKRQAESVAKRLSLYGIDKVFSSTSTRAMETAQPTCEINKKELTTLEFCHESKAGEFFGVPFDDGRNFWCFYNKNVQKIFGSREIKKLGDEWYEHPGLLNYREQFKNGVEYINGETDKLLLSLGYEHDREGGFYKEVVPNNERVALFAHQGFGLAFLSAVLDIPYPETSLRFDMGHTGMTVIDFSKNEDGLVFPRALTVANDSHLYHDGLPTYYHNIIRF